MIHGSFLAKIKNLIFLGSSCIYPKLCKQPMKESYLLSGKLEETNDAYAIAKIAGIMMCYNYSLNYKLNYQSLMPPNLFGPGDNYDLKNSHFFPALLKKIYLAKITDEDVSHVVNTNPDATNKILYSSYYQEEKKATPYYSDGGDY